MDPSLRPARSHRRWSPLLITLAAVGCASPGIPRPPTLNLPQPVRDLTATRIGDTVQLRFAVPSRSTDKLPLRGATLSATFCRELDHQPCQPIPASTTTIPITSTRDDPFTWTDTLPPDLTRGQPHTLGYRVSLANITGHSAGDSTPAFTATGPAPTQVEGLQADGSRLGIVLRWTPAPASIGAILLQREDLAPAPPKPATIHLIAPPHTPTDSLLDTTAHPDTPYRYTAMRSLTVQLGGRSIELHSSPSSPTDITLHQIYPPLTPTGLTVAPFTAPDATFAVDLVWQPVDEPGLITPLAGYNLYREAPSTPRTRLNLTPLQLPAFHDTTATPGTPYRYSVTSINTNGNESPAATSLLQP
jgi:hypothetical protein